MDGDLEGDLDVDLEGDSKGDFRGDFKQDMERDLLSSSGQRQFHIQTSTEILPQHSFVRLHSSSSEQPSKASPAGTRRMWRQPTRATNSAIRNPNSKFISSPKTLGRDI